MANEQNLIPGAHKLTVEEASKGGVNSGASRRESRRLHDLAQKIASDVFEKDGQPMEGAELVVLSIFEAVVKRKNMEAAKLFISLMDEDNASKVEFTNKTDYEAMLPEMREAFLKKLDEMKENEKA